MKTIVIALSFLLFTACGNESPSPKQLNSKVAGPNLETKSLRLPKKTVRNIHVFVALCDNDNQGIVPVPKILGNGDDPKNNLYWGAMYGTKSFLKKRKAWTIVKQGKGPSDSILERVVFKYSGSDVHLVADAYRGRAIKKALTDFLKAAGGNDIATLKLGKDILGLNGAADLIAYVGHNGLMDFDIPAQKCEPCDGSKVAIVLACKSKSYFQTRLSDLGCKSVLLTTGFMAPEAYTLDAAVRAWILGKPAKVIRENAAKAYNKYQKCGMRGANRLFAAEE